ncbi:MAG: class I SAM-dependent methyltransferase [Proteobacteria bacterium]|nr:class I SAM-dependent methyltransferase [Pseudomonadota bacterium]MBU4469356.1 class I SAM-dependent methyltransferase [Pseudomonadota bacterium]MCG2753571.1 class I SAM-dependent methyltransferase [Desulfobacteraceae bacterium]
MTKLSYLMENESETYRLDIKTDENIVKEQALWAGIKPGMRVADLGFGSGKTTYSLNQLVQPQGEVIGVDYASDRIENASRHYTHQSIRYIQRDIREALDDLGTFDFIWVRFVLEYHNSAGFEIIQNIHKILKPGGILQLIDLDHNCLCHFGLSSRLEKTLFDVMNVLQKKADFDPYAGRKLYSFLYDLGYQNIDVKMASHHLIYGAIGEVDKFNWTRKIEVAVKQLGFHFSAYPGGYEEFYEEFMGFFHDPRRLTYTPLFLCRGQKPF